MFSYCPPWQRHLKTSADVCVPHCREMIIGRSLWYVCLVTEWVFDLTLIEQRREAARAQHSGKEDNTTEPLKGCLRRAT